MFAFDRIQWILGITRREACATSYGARCWHVVNAMHLFADLWRHGKAHYSALQLCQEHIVNQIPYTNMSCTNQGLA